MQLQGLTNPASFELQRAVKDCNLKAVEAALSADADVNYTTNNGYTVLMWAALGGHTDLEGQAGRAVFGRISTLGRRRGDLHGNRQVSLFHPMSHDKSLNLL